MTIYSVTLYSETDTDVLLSAIQVLIVKLLCTAVIYSVHRRVENGIMYFVKDDMTYKSYNDIKSKLDEARNEFGADKFIEGEKNKAIEMAKKLLKRNVDIDIILETTGFTIDEIEKIKKDMGL